LRQPFARVRLAAVSVLRPVDQAERMRGFACSGALQRREIVELASAAESRGYDSFWITVIRGVTDPVAVLRDALNATSQIDIGLGLIPLDAYAVEDVAPRMTDVAARAIVGLGVGRRCAGAARLWREAATEMRRRVPAIRIAVGSYGPQVLHAGGGLADAALLNWMTPGRVRWATRELARGARDVGRAAAPQPIYVYLPTAVGPEARSTIDGALKKLAGYDYHRRHQAVLGVNPDLGLALDAAAPARVRTPDYGRGAQTVIHPLVADAESHTAILRRCAPA
jgi:Luciferase-like monooxygenase